MSDLISRQAAINIATEDGAYGYISAEELAKLPSARSKGKWIVKTEGIIFKREWGICSECGNTLDFSGVNAGRGDANFCPNCGADMRDGDSE